MLIFQELSRPISQTAFGRMVGRSEARVSQLVADGTLPAGGTALEWLHAYIDRLSAEAAGRASDGPLDLSQERAALARSAREMNEQKLSVLRGEYAPIGLLADVLAAASAAVVDRFDALPGRLRKECPDLPEGARDAIASTLASARNEWIRSTAELAIARLEELAGTDDEPEQDLAA